MQPSERDTVRLMMKLRKDPVLFTRVFFGVEPYEYQKDLLRTTAKRITAVWGRQSGKTTCIAWKVIHFAYTNPNVNVLIVSKGLRQSMIMYSVISSSILDNPILRKSVTRYTRTEVNIKNGSKIIALPCSSDGSNLRGHTAHMVIMDEAAFISETVISQVIFPMLATTNGTAIMLSTPWGRNHIFYRSFVDPNFWVQHVKSRDCPKITEDFLEEQRRLIGNTRYKIEYEAEFLEDATALFTQDMIRGAIEIWDDTKDKMLTEIDIRKTREFIGSYIIGVDLGKRLDHSVIAIFKREKKSILNKEFGKPIARQIWRLVFLKQFPLKTPLMNIATYVKFLAKKFTFIAGCVDQTGLGEAVVEELQMDLPWIEGIPLYGAQAKQAVAMFTYTRLEQQLIAIPMEERDLINQMNEQCYGYSAVKEKIITEEKGVMVFYHPEGRHDDQLWAMMLAIFSTRDRPASGIVL